MYKYYAFSSKVYPIYLFTDSIDMYPVRARGDEEEGGVSSTLPTVQQTTEACDESTPLLADTFKDKM